jgi:hypothetical protein
MTECAQSTLSFTAIVVPIIAMIAFRSFVSTGGGLQKLHLSNRHAKRRLAQ